MHRTLADSKLLRCLLYGSIFLNYIISDINRPFFYVPFQRNKWYLQLLRINQCQRSVLICDFRDLKFSLC